MTSVLLDETIQIRGNVLIIYEVDNKECNIHKQPSISERRASISMYTKAIPIRVASMHYCFNNNPLLHSFITLSKPFLNIQQRQRIQFHCGKFCTLQVSSLERGFVQCPPTLTNLVCICLAFIHTHRWPYGMSI